jgi:tetratricopeptide (TPR) repeat protein
LAQALSGLGSVLRRAGRLAAAEAACRRALALNERLAAAARAEPDDQGQLAAAYLDLGDLLKDAARPPEAERAYRRGLEAAGLADGGRAPPAARYRLAQGHVKLGHVLWGMDRDGEAERETRRGVALLEELAGGDPRDTRYRDELSRALGDLALRLDYANRPAEAEAPCRRGLDLLELLAADFPAVPDYRSRLARDLNVLGNILSNSGRLSEAERHYRRAVESLEKASAERPDNPEFRTQLADQTTALGAFLSATGRPREAEQAYRRALEVREKLVADFPAAPKFRYGVFLYRMHLAQLGQGGVTDAEVREALRELERYTDEPDVQNALAWFLAACRAPRFRDPRRAVELSRKVVGDHPENGAYWTTHGVALYRAGRVPDAVAALERSVRLRDGGDSSDWFVLAMAHWQLGDPYRAALYHAAAVRWMDRHRPRDDQLRRFRAEAAALLGVADGPQAQDGPPPKP